ncbi:MAG: hypothetical protein KGM42_00320 [Hyphomicrobiales bacterium]|nr:hypothetical protein [Hyphomicrobiales bacterium]
MRFLLAGGACLLLAACAQMPPPAFIRTADASMRGSAPKVGDAAAGTRDFKPVEPADWATINRGVAPKPRGEQP